jgi:two-component system NarL family sensor kinase
MFVRMSSNAKPDSGPSLRRQGAVAPVSRDLLVVGAFLLVTVAITGVFLLKVYLPRRQAEALAAAPAQLSLLARDCQNALTSWVRERLADADLAAWMLAERPSDAARSSEILEQFVLRYGYESAFLLDGAGNILIRRGADGLDDAAVVRFAQESLAASRSKIDFVRVRKTPKIFTARPLPKKQDAEAAVVLFVSDPYRYVYPLFSTVAIATRTGETNLIGLHDGWGTALNPYREGTPPPMTVRSPIPEDYAARVLRVGEQSIRYRDRDYMRVIGVVKAIPHTSWVLVAKIDEDEVLGDAYAETWRLGRLAGALSLLAAVLAVLILRSRRVNELRAAQEQLARLFDHSTTGILVFRVLFDASRTPIDCEIVDMNPAAEKLLGVEVSEERGKRSQDALYLQWPDEERARNYDVALGGSSMRYERFQPGLERWFEIRSFSPQFGQFAHLFTDITDRRKNEQAVRNLSARLLRVQDDTRRRLARELHDTVGQNLAAVRMNLAVMKRSAPSNQQSANIVDDSLEATDDAISQVRTLSFLLHPPMLEEAGLLIALRWYVEGFERRSGITTALEVDEDLGPLPRQLGITVVRLVQECLTNIQRHSGSATATVVLRRDERLFLEIADQGRGLPKTLRDDRDALLASGVGIAGMNERVRELGGELTIQSSDQGTTLRVTLPLTATD